MRGRPGARLLAAPGFEPQSGAPLGEPWQVDTLPLEPLGGVQRGHRHRLRRRAACAAAARRGELAALAVQLHRHRIEEALQPALRRLRRATAAAAAAASRQPRPFATMVQLTTLRSYFAVHDEAPGCSRGGRVEEPKDISRNLTEVRRKFLRKFNCHQNIFIPICQFRIIVFCCVPVDSLVNPSKFEICIS